MHDLEAGKEGGIPHGYPKKELDVKILSKCLTLANNKISFTIRKNKKKKTL